MAHPAGRVLRASIIVAPLILGPALAARAQSVTPGRPDEPGGYASDRLVVKLKPGFEADVAGGRWLLRAPSGAGTQMSADLTAVNAELGRRGTRGIFPVFERLPANPAIAQRYGLERYLVIHVPQGTATPEMVTRLARRSRVIELAQLDGVGGVADTTPDDPSFPVQYGLLNVGQNIAGSPGVPGADVNATMAWDITTGSSQIVMGVVDAGVTEHQELVGRSAPGWAFDGGTPGDSCGSHGTHVTGIAAANTNNAQGTAGMNWGMKARSFRVLAGCNGLESNVAAGILEAVAQDVDLINCSLQFYSGSQVLHDAVKAAYDAGIPILAATGNNQAPGIVAYPARWPEPIAVAATNNRDEHPSFSNSGPQTDVAAPGDEIYSLSGLFAYVYKDGTSMSAPFVSGLVGLMLSLDGTLTIEEIRTILQDTADDVQAPGFDSFSGWGRINAHAALLAVLDGLAVPGDITGDGVVNVEDLVALFLSWGLCDEGCDADLDEDGVVGVLDLVVVLSNWS